jgi:hypothetical protein
MRHLIWFTLSALLLCFGWMGAQEEVQPPADDTAVTKPAEPPTAPLAGEAAPAAEVEPGPVADQQGQPVPKEWSVMPYLPEDTVLAITVKDVAKAREAFSKTGLYQLLASPELTDAVRGPLLLAKGMLWMTEQRHGYKLKDIISSFQGEVSVALVGFQETLDEHGKKMPDLLVAFQPRGQAGNAMKVVDKFVSDLNKLAQGQLMLQQSTFAGAQINTLSVPNNPMRIAYTLHNGTFLAALNPAQLESVLSRYQAGAEKQPAQGLAKDPTFQRAWAKIGEHAEALAYFNLEAGRKIPEMNMQPKTEKDRRGLRATGLDEVRALTYSVAFKDQDIHETLFVDCPAKVRRGLMAMLDNDPIPASALESMPQNAIFASAWKTDLVKFLDRLIKLAGVTNPGDAELIEHEINKVNEKHKIDFRKDLLAAFNGQVLFSLAIPSKHPKLGFGFPQPIVRMGVTDSAAAEKALDILRHMGQDVFDYSDLAAGDKTIVVARAKKRQKDDPGQICWTLTEHEILLSIYPLALRDELNRLAAAKPRAGSNPQLNNLTMDPQFQRVRGQLGEDHRMLMYIDVSAIATVFYDTYIPMAQLNPKIAPPHVNLNNLPTADFLTRNLGGLVVGVNADEEGILMESCSATGLWTTMTPMMAVAARAAQRHRRARNAPDNAPEQAENRQLLREVGTRLTAYAQDHDNAFPKQLTELVPNYATQEELEQAGALTYLGKQDAPNRVVAHSPNEAGHVVVLLQDGRVRTVEAGRLAETLERGYAAPPQPQATGVKPPVPPPDF